MEDLKCRIRKEENILSKLLMGHTFPLVLFLLLMLLPFFFLYVMNETVCTYFYVFIIIIIISENIVDIF